LQPESSGFSRLSICTIASLAFFFALIRVSAGAGDGPATATVRNLLASIGKLRTTTDETQRSKLNASIDGSLAIEKLSQQALGAQWSKLDRSERGHFISLVKHLLEKIAYPNAAQFFSGFKVNFVGEETHSADHIVRTTVSRSEGGAVSIDYILRQENGRWIVQDVILDRQSLAASVTSQIQATLKSGSYQDLVAQMEKRLAQAGSPSSVK